MSSVLSALFGRQPELSRAQVIERKLELMARYASLNDVEGGISCAKEVRRLATDAASREAILAHGGIKLCVDLSRSSNEDAQFFGARTLRDSITDSDENRTNAVDVGALDVMAQLLKEPSWDVALAASQVLSQIFALPQLCQRRSVLSSGVVEGLCIVGQSKNTDAHLPVVQCLARLSTQRAVRHAIAEHKGIDAVVFMSQGSPTAEVRLLAAQAIGNLSADEAKREAIVDAGAVGVVVNCLEYYDPRVVLSCLVTLNNLHTDLAMGQVMSLPFAVKQVVHHANSNLPPESDPAARYDPHSASPMQRNEDIFTAAVKLLLRLSENEEHIPRLLERGLLDLLVDLSQSSTPAHHALAAKGFANMSADDHAQKQIVDSKTYLGALCQLGTGLNPETNEFTAFTLLRLTTNPSLHPSLVAYDRVLTLLVRYALIDDVQTRRYAAHAISKLAHNIEISAALNTPALLSALGMMLNSHDEAIVQHGAVAVSALAIDKEKRRRLDVTKGVRCLVQFGSSRNAQMQIQAASALGNTALNMAATGALEGEGAIRLLETMTYSPNPEVKDAATMGMSNFHATQVLGELAYYCLYRNPSTMRAVPPVHIADLLGFVAKSLSDQDFHSTRVAVMCLANLNANVANAKIFLERRGLTIISPLIPPSSPSLPPFPHLVRSQAMKAVGHCAHDAETAQAVVQHPGLLTSILDHVQVVKIADQEGASSVAKERGVRRVIQACNTLARIAEHSREGQAVVVGVRGHGGDGLRRLVAMLEDPDDDNRVQLAGCRLLEVLASDPAHCQAILRANALPALFRMIDSSAIAVTRQGIATVSNLCRTSAVQDAVMRKIGVPRLLALLGHVDTGIQQQTANLLGRVVTNKRHGVQYTLELLRHNGTDAIVNMAFSPSDECRMTALRSLTFLCSNAEVRRRLRQSELPDAIREISLGYNVPLKQVGAQTLICLLRVDDDSEDVEPPRKHHTFHTRNPDLRVAHRLIESDPTSILHEAVRVAMIGGGRFACDTAGALVLLATKRFALRKRIAECGGVKAALNLLRSAQRPVWVGLELLLLLSEDPSLPIDIAANEAFPLLLSLAARDPYNDSLNPEDEEGVAHRALKIICNVCLDEMTHRYLLSVGGKAQLNAIAQTASPSLPNTPMGEEGEEEDGLAMPPPNAKVDPNADARRGYQQGKALLAYCALGYLEAPEATKHLQVLHQHRRKLKDGEVAKMLALSIAHSHSLFVDRQIAHAIANAATTEHNVELVMLDNALPWLLDVVESPSFVVAEEAVRGIGNLALHDGARVKLSQMGAVPSLGGLFRDMPLLSLPPSLVLEAVIALSNLCQPPCRDTNVVVLVKSGLLRPLAQLVAVYPNAQVNQRAEDLLEAFHQPFAESAKEQEDLYLKMAQASEEAANQHDVLA